MALNLSLVNGPDTEPISRPDAKSHLRVDISDDDDYIDTLVIVAREYVERFTNRALITQTWNLVLDSFPCGDTMRIPRPPLQSVNHITYKDRDGNESVIAAEDYIVDTDKTPGEIVLAHGKTWPGVTLYPASPITVQFVAGYGDAADVPERLIHAMKLLIGHWYERREQVSGVRTYEIPLGIDALLWPERVGVTGWKRAS